MNELIAGYASYASTEAILREQAATARLMITYETVTVVSETVSWSMAQSWSL